MADPGAFPASGRISARMLAAIRARPLARAALWILALLYTLAIFAPFLAGDRPLYVHGEGRSPVLEALSPIEIVLMVLWLAALLAPLLRRAIRRGPSGGALVGLAVASALAAALALGAEGAPFATSDWKDRIASGEIQSGAAVFPPIRMGFAETNLAEAYRPPTWLASSEISEEGAYVRGSRVPQADPVTHLVPEPSPVEVRPFEPARNSPWRHPLGTDGLGRDLLVRLLYGARTSLSVGLLSAAALFAIGVLVGALAGWFRGPVDLLLSRGIEVVLCFPAFFLVLFVLSAADPDTLPPVLSIALVIALVGWPSVARLVRAEFLRLREADFVLAARALGCSPARAILAHVLPNAIGPALVAASFAVGAGALVEAALSYLGLGVQSPIPSWGALVNESHAPSHWWLQLFPGLAILVSVVCYNLVGEALREALDPRLLDRAEVRR
ncbi:MAG TPA: ABC transporter permease [Myxococcota bacterium]|nr:ABC transporter permease [Myxococcota bacterium]